MYAYLSCTGNVSLWVPWGSYHWPRKGVHQWPLQGTICNHPDWAQNDECLSSTGYTYYSILMYTWIQQLEREREVYYFIFLLTDQWIDKAIQSNSFEVLSQNHQWWLEWLGSENWYSAHGIPSFSPSNNKAVPLLHAVPTEHEASSWLRSHAIKRQVAIVLWS